MEYDRMEYENRYRLKSNMLLIDGAHNYLVIALERMQDIN